MNEFKIHFSDINPLIQEEILEAKRKEVKEEFEQEGYERLEGDESWKEAIFRIYGFEDDSEFETHIEDIAYDRVTKSWNCSVMV